MKKHYIPLSAIIFVIALSFFINSKFGSPSLILQALKFPPIFPTKGSIYLADGENWDPCGIGKKVYTMYDGNKFICLLDEDGALYYSRIEETKPSSSELQVSKPHDFWYNFRTKKMDPVESGKIIENYKDYLPQDMAVQTLYQTYILMGKTPTEAFILVASKLIESIEKKGSPI